MSTLKVQIVFDLNVNGAGDFFTLDHADKGKLDNTDFLLAGDQLTDVSDVVRKVTIERGRNRQLEKFTAGTASIQLDNRNRDFDPTMTTSPFFGQILPRKKVVISDQDVVLYTGNIADWNFGYTLNSDSIAEVQCIDAIATIVDKPMTAGTQSAGKTGARINTTLDDISWPALDRSISTGRVDLGTDVVAAETKALDYMNKVTTSESGALFVSKLGSIEFKDVIDLQRATSTVFGASDIPFSEISVEYGIEEMTNSAVVKWVGGEVTYQDADSIDAYGLFETTYTSVLPTEVAATLLAQYQVGLYAQPQYRVDKITTLVHLLSVSQQKEVHGLELGDVVLVKFHPNNVGAEIVQAVSIDHIDFDGVAREERKVTFSMSQTAASFILDDITFGILDTGILGF